MKYTYHKEMQILATKSPLYPPFPEQNHFGTRVKTSKPLLMLILILIPLNIWLLLLLTVFSLHAYSAEYVMGRITESMGLEERIYLTAGDKAVTSLGMKDGIIRGDILEIASKMDTGLTSPIGRCALIKVDNESSICEIIRVKKEIGKGDIVFDNRLYSSDERLYPRLYELLYKTVEPYEPNKKINVYIHNIFDKNLNITTYSSTIKEEIANIFSQKHRIVLKDSMAAKDFSFYPLDDKDNMSRLYNLIRNENIDVFITGLYSLENGVINITFHKYDRRFGREVLPFQIKMATEKDIEEAKEIILSFKLAEKHEPVTCTISYNEFTDSISKYGKAEIDRFEADGNIFNENDLKSREFNTIAPTDVLITIDGERVNVGDSNELKTTISRGSHKIAASFKRGYFLNSKGALAYTSKKTIKKEMILLVKKDGDINIEIDLNPEFDKENISFKVFKETANIRPQIKAIKSTKSDTWIETFVD